jgi:hypothetical protein
LKGASGDYHERTNQIAIHFSPKVVLLCSNSCCPSGTGNHAVNVRRACSTKRSSPCRRTNCSEDEKEKEEEGYVRDYGRSSEQSADTTKTAVVPGPPQ